MAKSAKAKKEKQKDFQKQKLKIGKTKPKAINLTDASFRSRSINVLQQSLNETAPSTSSQFAHHLSLLSHKSESQRKESLSHLSTTLQSEAQSDSRLPLPASAILSKVLPLLLDASGAVRAQCIKVIEAIPEDAVQANTEQLLLYARAAITHLSARIQLTGLDVLEWLLNVAGQDVVSCPGGWLKTLNCLLVVLSWKDLAAEAQTSTSGWKKTGTNIRRTSRSEDDEKLRTRQLQVLELLLEKGLCELKDLLGIEDRQRISQKTFPYFLYHEHQISKQRNPYGYLNLFGPLRDEESEQYQDREDRARVFSTYAANDIEVGVGKAKQEGGGVGRAARAVERVMNSLELDML
jgi:pre-rRNA-processing protein IPI1